MSMLEDIFHNYYNAQLPQTPEYKALRERRLKFWDYIEEKVGREYLDENWKDFSDMEEAEQFRYFREGFVLGASLMLELRS